MSLRRLFGLAPKAEPQREVSEALSKTIASLDHMDPAESRELAAFAYLLGRVAYADLDISLEEVDEMRAIVAERAALTTDQAALVVQIAKTHNEHFGGTEKFQVTQLFDAIADKDEKMALLDCLFAVAAADEHISQVEDNEIRRVANELGLTHREFIAVRSQWKQYLSVLKGDEG